MIADLEYALFRQPAPEPGAGSFGKLTRRLEGPGLTLQGDVVVQGNDVYPLSGFMVLRLKSAPAPAAEPPPPPAPRGKRGSRKRRSTHAS